MIDWVHKELLAWGAWLRANCLREVRGFPSQVPWLREAVQQSRRLDYTPTERTPEDFSRIHRYVERVHPQSVRDSVVRLYKDGYSIRATGRAVGLDEKTIRNHRDEAHRQIARYWEMDSKSTVKNPVDNGCGNPQKGD